MDLMQTIQNGTGNEDGDDILSLSCIIEPPMPNSLLWSHEFQFTLPGNFEHVHAMLLNGLPDTNTTRRRLDIYWRHASWM